MPNIIFINISLITKNGIRVYYTLEIPVYVLLTDYVILIALFLFFIIYIYIYMYIKENFNNLPPHFIFDDYFTQNIFRTQNVLRQRF